MIYYCIALSFQEAEAILEELKPTPVQILGVTVVRGDYRIENYQLRFNWVLIF